ncbi:MAG: sulfite exporter TauE/SafE family protein, partial [Mariprofundaceae bacterium]|nr:sulfite exporter TauE/SafE family protein [Mariprofundaceae bacterium]
AVLCGTLMAASALMLNALLVPAWLAMLHAQLWFIGGVLAGVLLVLPHATQWSARLHVQMRDKEMQLLLRGVFALLAVLMTMAALYKLFI